MRLGVLVYLQEWHRPCRNLWLARTCFISLLTRYRVYEIQTYVIWVHITSAEAYMIYCIKYAASQHRVTSSRGFAYLCGVRLSVCLSVCLCVCLSSKMFTKCHEIFPMASLWGGYHPGWGLVGSPPRVRARRPLLRARGRFFKTCFEIQKFFLGCALGSLITHQSGIAPAETSASPERVLSRKRPDIGDMKYRHTLYGCTSPLPKCTSYIT